MKSSVLFPDSVLNRVKYLPDADRRAIFDAFEGEMLYNRNPNDTLSPFQAMLYSFVKFYINREMACATL